MGRQRPEKKRELAPPTTSMVLPMQLRVGDRFGDETAQWEVVGPPYSTGGGKIVHASVQRIDQPASGEVQSWAADCARLLSENQSSRLLCLFPKKEEDSSHFTNLGEELLVLISGEVCHAIASTVV